MELRHESYKYNKIKGFEMKAQHRYGEASKSNGVVYFEVIVARNRFSIAYSGFNL